MVLRRVQHQAVSLALVLSASFLLSLVCPQGWLFTKEQFARQMHTREAVKEKLKKLSLFPPEANQVGDHGSLSFVQWAHLKAPSQELLNNQLPPSQALTHHHTIPAVNSQPT